MEHGLPINILGLVLLSSVGVLKACFDGFGVSQITWFSAYFAILEKTHGTRNMSMHQQSVVNTFLCLWSIFNIVRWERPFLFHLNFLTK